MTRHQERLAVLVQWLRDNSDKQITGALRSKDCFCFEGAMCEVYRKRTHHGRWLADGFNLYDSYSFSLSPKQVDNYFSAGFIVVGNKDYNPTAVNDGLKLTFPQIADLIEVQWAEPKGD